MSLVDKMEYCTAQKLSVSLKSFSLSVSYIQYINFREAVLIYHIEIYPRITNDNR